jgi:hypothetical protein
MAGEHPSPRAAEASEPRSIAVTNARMASTRSIVAVSVINHCRLRCFYPNLQRSTLALMIRSELKPNMRDVPHLMRAVIAEAVGESQRLMQVSTPRPRAGEVLVRVMASALNPLDVKILAGMAEHVPKTRSF